MWTNHSILKAKKIANDEMWRKIGNNNQDSNNVRTMTTIDLSKQDRNTTKNETKQEYDIPNRVML